MSILLPDSVKSSLDWLKFTPEEERTVDFIYATSLMVKGFGGNEDIVSGIHGCWLSAHEMSASVGDNWVKFIEENIFSLEELRLLVSDQSPYYGLGVRGRLTPSERFCYLMGDVNTGRWAPRRMREFWENELLRHGGDSIAAEVGLEFLRPKVSV